MSWLVDMLLEWVKRTFLDHLISELKAQAAIYYLKGVKGLRRVLILFCLMIFIVALIGAGFVLIPLSLLLFSPWTGETKAIVGIAIGAFYVLVPLVGMALILSERRWMSITGARDTVDKLLE